MCGRFTLSTEKKDIEEKFQITLDIPISKRYNISPTQEIIAVTQEDGIRKANLFKWGLVPFWAKEQKMGSKMINARAETLHEKPSFRHLIKRKRCLILADGFFEWKKDGNNKQPFFIHMKNRKPFSFAGLWDTWSKDDLQITTCTIITTIPNKLMQQLHDRMPVILNDEQRENIWLDESLTDTDYLQSLLTPYSDEEMNAYPVSNKVNSPKHEHADNIEALRS